MTRRTVRFDKNTDAALQLIMRVTGLSTSQALKRCVLTYDPVALASVKIRPWDVYASLDVGPGTEALAPAADSKGAIVNAIESKHHRH